MTSTLRDIQSQLQSHGRQPSQAFYLQLLLDTLSTAVSHRLPLAPAVKSLLRDYAPFRVDAFNAWGWRIRFQRLAADLASGLALSAGLERQFGGVLPPHLLKAIAEAEARQRLPDVLPVLARCFRHATLTRQQWKAALLYPFVQLTTCGAIATGVLVFIVPKFTQILDELNGFSGAMARPPAAVYLMALSGWIEWVLFGLLLTGVVVALSDSLRHRAPGGWWTSPLGHVVQVLWCCAIALVVCTFFFHGLEDALDDVVLIRGLLGNFGLWVVFLVRVAGGLGLLFLCFLVPALVIAVPLNALGRRVPDGWSRGIERWLFAVPLVGPQLRCLRLWEVAQGMTAMTLAGADVATAAAWTRDASRSPSARVALERFIREVRAGRNWADAWEMLGLGKPMHDWLVRNAAAREDPASGFQLLEEWLTDEASVLAQRTVRWLEPALILANCAFLGSIVVCTFSLLIRMVLTTLQGM